jgi:cyclopropane-fatty-acyl-phospholipid synthase
MWRKKITNQFLDSLKHLEYGSIEVRTPDGAQYFFSGRQAGPDSTLYLHDWRAIPAFALRGDIGFAEAYREGWWDSDDLVKLFTVGLMNESVLDSYIYGSLLGKVAAQISYLFTRNTLKGSRRNIHAHYDLGNSFYKLWLDETMTYSSAIFADAEEALPVAQYRKYDRITERLGDSGRLLELGCGWGGFAERALEKKDFAIKGVTLSEEQHAYATQRLGRNADIVIEDYRHQQGKYDNIVSIEMFEAVGEQYWPTYFNKVKSLLADKGKAVVQTITIDERYFDRYRITGDVIRSYIFPGGMLPSPTRFAQEAGKAELQVTDRFDFGQDYALTMEHWLKRFERKVGEIRLLGFDEPFIRLWRFYLAVCAASFRTGRTSVMQVELQHA